MTLLLCAVSGAWADPTYKSSFTDLTSDDNGNYYTYLKTSDYSAFITAGWMSYTGSSTGSATLKIDPKTDATISGSSATYGKVKNDGSRYMEFYVTGITSIKFYFANTGSSDRKIQYKLNGGDATDLVTVVQKTSDAGSIALDAATNNTIRIFSPDNDVFVCALKVTPNTVPDETAPTFSESTPANGATGVAKSGNIAITFSENVSILDASKFTLTGGVGTLNTAGATVSGATVTIPYSGLAASTTYTFSTAAGAVEDAAHNANAALDDIAFTTTTSTYVFNAPVKYALTVGDGFTSGQTVDVQDGGETVATITYGEAGGEDFKAAAEATNIDGYTAFTEGNGTNGDKAKGTWYTIVPKYDAVISVAVALNKDKNFYIKENGSALSDYNGFTVGEKYYGTYEFKASADKSYKVYCSGSKLGFYGFTMSPYATATVGTYSWVTFASDKALDFTKVAGKEKTLKAYMITGHSSSAISKSAAVENIPANTGLLLEGNGTETTYYIPVIASSSTDVSANKLKAGTGAAVAAESGKTKYVLSVSGGKAAFKKINATSATVPVGKAYLQFDEVIEAPLFDLDGEATNIKAVEAKAVENGEYYNLAGQRVAQPTKGLYIVNGKKVIIK